MAQPIRTSPHLTVIPAEDGGFTVVEENLSMGHRSAIRFAGELEGVLAYLRGRYTLPAQGDLPLGEDRDHLGHGLDD